MLASTTKAPMRNALVRRFDVRSLKLNDGSDGFLFSSGPRTRVDAESGRRCTVDSSVGSLEALRRGIRRASEAISASYIG